MKHFLITLTAIIAMSFSSRAQYITIPDPDFKTYLMNRYPGCFNASGQMDTTCSAIINETDLTPSYYIANWQGFQYFRNLQRVTFEFNYPTDLPALPSTLKELFIDPLGSSFTTLPALPAGLTRLTVWNTQYLTSLPALPASLIYLDCKQNQSLTSLPALPGSLRFLRTYYCPVGSLPTLPASLDTLECTNSALTTIPSLPNSLMRLICNRNTITALPSLPATLEYLDASENQLSAIPTIAGTVLTTLQLSQNSLAAIPTLPSSLQTLDVSYNQITSLPSLPTVLTTLQCSRNQLTALPAIPAGLLNLAYANNAIPVFPAVPNSLRSLNCSGCGITNIPSFSDSLRDINCAGNQLTSLPVFPNYLNYVDCSSNQITSLPPLPAQLIRLSCQINNITCMPVLPNSSPNLWEELSLTFDNTINCIPNNPIYYCSMNVWNAATGTFAAYSNEGPSFYPLCSAVNNVNHCAAFPLMTGHVYYDNNNNGTHDVNEPYRANVKVLLSNGAWTYTNSSGYYQVAANGIGNYSTAISNIPSYFGSVPSQYNFNFTSYDTLTVDDFGLQATATKDSLTISIEPLNWPRPGFQYPCYIRYINDGTTTLNPNVVFNYDNTRLIYDSSSNASVINTGSSLTLSETGFAPGMQRGFMGYFRVNPSAVIGDSLRSGAHITAGSVAAHDSDVVAIRGSFDPNDKSATPKLTTTQLTNGDYIYYTIRFQNTGTDTAFNIIVTDTLNNRLQPSTLQMIATSHPCITTVKGNAISFEFINIMLPDSNVSEIKSHGYISFRIKPVNTLVVNDVVTNKASIYFDYNSPVVTNSAITTIIEPVVLPLKLLSFNVSRGIGLNANLYWQTNDEVNVKDYAIEMSTNGRTFIAVASENAKGYQYNSYTKSIAIPSASILYFRLKITDIDGRFSYSNVAILRNDNAGAAFSFANNPVKDELNISLLDESLRNTVATIFSSQGVKLRTILLQHDVETINVKSLPAGTYYLVTEQGSRQFVVVK